jgi:CRP-like cAMP-binding protein
MKHSNTAINYLKHVAFFSACTDKELALIASTTTQLRFTAGQVLAREGARGHEFMVIVDGTARVDIDGHEIAMLTPGEFFGEIASCSTAAPHRHGDRRDRRGRRGDRPAEFSSVVMSAPHLARNLLIGLARRLRKADVHLAH